MNAARRGFSIAETLAAVLVLSIASAAALTSWHISVRAPGNKRVTEMGVYVGVRHLEQIKAARFLSLDVTSAGAPLIAYYDRYGAAVAQAAAQGYTVKTWMAPWVNRDGVINAEDIREITIEVWDNGLTRRYERIRTLLTFGGL